MFLGPYHIYSSAGVSPLGWPELNSLVCGNMKEAFQGQKEIHLQENCPGEKISMTRATDLLQIRVPAQNISAEDTRPRSDI